MEILRLLGKGVGHEDKGQNCQDKIGLMIIEDERRIFAISDGCSSSAYAEEAAQKNIDVINNIFSHFAIEKLSADSFISLYPELTEELSKFDKDDLASCFDSVFKYEIYNLAQEHRTDNVKYSDFCATVLFVVLENNTTI